MYNMRNNRSFGGSRYQYQTLPYGYEGTQSSGLISKVMGLLAVSFLSAAIGTFIGIFVLPVSTFGTYFMLVIVGFVVLIVLQFMIQKPGINLFLLYLFTFIEGMALAPIIGYYTAVSSYIVSQAFLITAIVALGLSAYAWTTKRDFTRIGDYLFVGMILLLVVSIIGLFFHSSLVVLAISFFGVAIFSGYVLYYVQKARYMADTLPNAIGLTVSLFLTLLNLFLYILQILAILQGGDRRR